MRCENLPGECHDKVIWKRSRHHSRDKASRQCNSETWWRRIAATLLGVSFGSNRRRCRDVQMRRRGYVPLRRLGWHATVTLLGVSFETYLIRCGDVLMGRRHYVPLRHRYDKPMRRCEDVPLSCLSDVPLRRHWVFQLKGTCDVAGTWKDVVMTSPGCLVVGWVNSGKKK